MTGSLEDESVLDMDASAFENAVKGIGRWLAEGGGHRLPEPTTETEQVTRDFERGLDQLAHENSVGPAQLKGARRDLLGIALAAEREAVDVTEGDRYPVHGTTPPEISAPDEGTAEEMVRTALEANGFEEGRSMRAVVKDVGVDELGRGLDRVLNHTSASAMIARVERPADWETTPGSRAERTETPERNV